MHYSYILLIHILLKGNVMKDKEKKKKKEIVEIKLTEEDIKISLLELKQRVGAPKIDFRRRR